MLYDLIKNLAEASTEEEKERAYKQLELVGMDRATANTVVSELKK